MDRRHHIMVVSIVDLRSRTAIPEVECFGHEKIGLHGWMEYVTKKMSFNEKTRQKILIHLLFSQEKLVALINGNRFSICQLIKLIR